MDIPQTKRMVSLLKTWSGKSREGKEKLENLTLRCDNLKRTLRIYIIIEDYVIVSSHSTIEL
tara:strand:+ start:199 stop:384 length:186 start_codon:yes stop_codon:yes gene_type:complete